MLQDVTALIWISSSEFDFAKWIRIFCSELEFAVANLNLQLTIWICRSEFEFAVVNLNLPQWIWSGELDFGSEFEFAVLSLPWWIWICHGKFELSWRIRIWRGELQQQYVSEWKADIGSLSKLNFYGEIKEKYTFEKYLDFIDNRQHKAALTKLRITAHRLHIETGRYKRYDWGSWGGGGVRIPVPSIEIIQNPSPNMKKEKIPSLELVVP